MKQWDKANPAYTSYIHSNEWRQKANKRLDLDGHICQVCGAPATEVHHMTYDNFMAEPMEDLVSLCKACHEKAEELYDPSITPWAMDRKKAGGYNFMAAMREDALTVSKLVIDWLIEKRGGSFKALMGLRQPEDMNNRQYWERLRKATEALCRKRYWYNCAMDRQDIMLNVTANHVVLVTLAQIEHYIRNGIQARLHDHVDFTRLLYDKWVDVEKELDISAGTRRKLQTDDGTSFGPSVRETLLYYCALDAAAGIDPEEGFSQLSIKDYTMLRSVAEYMRGVSGDSAFKGEYSA